MSVFKQSNDNHLRLQTFSVFPLIPVPNKQKSKRYEPYVRSPKKDSHVHIYKAVKEKGILIDPQKFDVIAFNMINHPAGKSFYI